MEIYSKSNLNKNLGFWNIYLNQSFFYIFLKKIQIYEKVSKIVRETCCKI